MIEKLNPCPNCGGEAEYNEFSISPSEPLEKYILCRNCDIIIHSPDCVEMWNSITKKSKIKKGD